jgi:hypothetical protein
MLKFRQIFLKKIIIWLFKSLNNTNRYNKKKKLSLLPKNQTIKNSYISNAFIENTLKKEVAFNLKYSGKFYTADQIFVDLSKKIIDKKFTSTDIDQALEELEKEKIIYLYKLPFLGIELWGTANLLDRNLVPMETCIADTGCRAFIRRYKYQNRM